MKLFGLEITRSRPPEVKDSAIGGSIVMTPGQPQWSGRDYKQFADEAYVRNVVANRCISSIAEAVASVPLMVYRGETELTESPLHTLFRRPNPAQTWGEYVEAVVGYLLISGNTYQEAVSASRGTVAELYALRPDRMKVIPGQDGLPVGYQYTVNGKTTRWDVDIIAGVRPVLHTRLFHPVNDWYGMAPVEAGAYAVDVHNEAMAYTQAYLQNAAKPSGALVTREGEHLSDENYARLKAQMEDQYQGSKNAGRPMLLEGGLTWQAMGGTPKDAAIIEVKNSAARDICLAFGVPPMLIGIPGDNTYANYAEARLAFWEDTVLPLLARMVEGWQGWLAEPLGLEIKPDLDQIPAIVEKRQALWTMLAQSDVLTPNEKRDAMGYEAIPGGDELRAAPDVSAMGPTELRALAYGLETK